MRSVADVFADGPRLSCPRLFYDTVVISDAHLGLRGASADLLWEFLKTVHCKTLIINGDLIDDHPLTLRQPGEPPHYTEMEMRVFDRLLDMAAHGVKIIYIPGNHDEKLRQEHLYREIVRNVEIKPFHAARYGGKIYLFEHGDRFSPPLLTEKDTLLMRNHMLIKTVILPLNDALDRAVNRVTNHHFSLMKIMHGIYEQGRVTAPFMRAAAAAACTLGVDRIFTGHIHDAQTSNSGDWVTNCTALGIDEDGTVTSIDWRRERKALGNRNRPRREDKQMSRAQRPQTLALIEKIGRFWPGENRIFFHPVGVLQPEITREAIARQLCAETPDDTPEMSPAVA